MNGLDPGAIGQAIITWGGGGAGAKIAAAGTIIAWLLTGCKAIHAHNAWITTLSCCGAWIFLFALRQFFQITGF